MNSNVNDRNQHCLIRRVRPRGEFSFCSYVANCWPTINISSRLDANCLPCRRPSFRAIVLFCLHVNARAVCVAPHNELFSRPQLSDYFTISGPHDDACILIYSVDSYNGQSCMLICGIIKLNALKYIAQLTID